jgi:hypothetical protein
MYSYCDSASEMLWSTLYRLRAQPIRDFPFAHFYCGEAFDQGTLDAINRHWPTDANFKSISETARVPAGSYPERKIVTLDELTHAGTECNTANNFWLEFKAAFGSDEFLSGVFQWLLPSINQVRRLPKQVNLSGEVLLTEDDAGYALSPHTDAPSRLATLLFFVPQSNEIEFAGTSLYVSKTSKYGGEISAVHRPREEFDKVFTVPFRANSCLGFVVGPASFHGAEKMPRLNIPRRMIHYCLRWSGV